MASITVCVRMVFKEVPVMFIEAEAVLRSLFFSCETCCLLQESSASIVTETEASLMESHVRCVSFPAVVILSTFKL